MTIREAAIADGCLTGEEFDKLVSPGAMTRPDPAPDTDGS
jgi:fumarate hydratase class II